MSFFSKLIAPVVLVLGLASNASAAILLTVDVTNPNAVTFTGTEEMPIANGSTSVFRGFTLLDFLTASSTVSFVTNQTSTLVGRGASQTLHDIFFPSNAGRNDLNIYDSSANGTINLRTDRPAFRNVLTADAAQPQRRPLPRKQGWAGCGASIPARWSSLPPTRSRSPETTRARPETTAGSAFAVEL